MKILAPFIAMLSLSCCSNEHNGWVAFQDFYSDNIGQHSLYSCHVEYRELYLNKPVTKVSFRINSRNRGEHQTGEFFVPSRDVQSKVEWDLTMPSIKIALYQEGDYYQGQSAGKKFLFATNICITGTNVPVAP